MIHPILEGAPDREFAEAVSELIVPQVPHPFRYARTPDSYEQSPNFPPVPSYITNVTAAYVGTFPGEQGPVIRRQMVVLDPDKAPSRNDYIERYANTIGGHQAIAVNGLFRILSHIPDLSSQSKLSEWYKNETLKQNRRLVVAHILARTAGTGEVIEAVAAPKSLTEDLVLKIRELSVSLRPYSEELFEFMDEKTAKKAKDAMAEFLRVDPAFEKVGVLAASMTLPTAEEIKDIAGRLYPRSKPAPTKRTGLPSKKKPKKRR